MVSTDSIGDANNTWMLVSKLHRLPKSTASRLTTSWSGTSVARLLGLFIATLAQIVGASVHDDGSLYRRDSD